MLPCYSVFILSYLSTAPTDCFRPVSFTAWNDSQPNNLWRATNEPENCLQINEYFDFKWNDLLCSAEIGYICEKV